MNPAAMVTARDKLGLLVALIGVGVLLWFGVSHFGASGAGAPVSPPPGQAAGQRAAAITYLKRLQRIDAPIEEKERRAGPVVQRAISNPGPMTATVTNVVRAVADGYARAASRVQQAAPAPGFANAQALLARVYNDQSRYYLSVLKLADNTTAQSDPTVVLDELTRIDNALGAFNNDLTACRTAFQESTATAGVPYPAWVAALINRATGQSS
jgi:hypothetical protein